VPRILERRYLRLGFGPRFVLEQDVVIAVGIKRRVQIDQVNRLVPYAVPQDVQIVAVVKGVHGKTEGNVAPAGFPGKARSSRIGSFSAILYRMQLKQLLECPSERVTLFVAARFAGREAADEAHIREKDGKPPECLYIPDRIEQDKAAKVEFAISYLIRMQELK